MTWIAVVVGLQAVFIYLVLGRRHAFLACPGESRLGLSGRRSWREVAVGFVMAAILSLPVVIGLTLLDEWVRPVGALEIVVAQGLYWLSLVRWAKRYKAAARPAEVAAPPQARAAAAPPSPPPASAPRHVPKADVGMQIEKLTKLYLWDNIGTREPFRTARKLPARNLMTDDDRASSGAALIDAMRGVARRIIALYRDGGDAADSAGHPLDAIVMNDFDEYAADVMQRLTYSVLLERERLFIDQTDIEIFGEETIGLMYRLALLEVRSSPATVKGAAASSVHLQQSPG